MAASREFSAPLGTIAEIQTLIEEISAGSQGIETGDAVVREVLAEKAQTLVNFLRSPSETMLWTAWAEPTRFFATRAAVSMKLFETIVSDDGRPKSVDELAKPVGASHHLTLRIARHCAAMNMFKQTGQFEFAPNALTKAYADPIFESSMIFCHDLGALPFAKWTKYFEETKYESPQDPTDGPFQYAMGTSPFPMVFSDPFLMKHFFNYFEGQFKDQPFWSDYYPVAEKLIKGLNLNGDASAIVDMGGNVGHVTATFLAKTPEYKGRLIVQDEVAVIEGAKNRGLDQRIELQAHDFFQPQPVKGARGYFLRWVLHDWSDEKCRIILGHVKDVMTPGYSKVLINENVMGNSGANWQQTSLDMYMISLVAAKERTEQDWRDLAASVGLKVTGIYEQKVPGKIGIVELML